MQGPWSRAEKRRSNTVPVEAWVTVSSAGTRSGTGRYRWPPNSKGSSSISTVTELFPRAEPEPAQAEARHAPSVALGFCERRSRPGVERASGDGHATRGGFR